MAFSGGTGNMVSDEEHNSMACLVGCFWDFFYVGFFGIFLGIFWDVYGIFLGCFLDVFWWEHGFRWRTQ